MGKYRIVTKGYHEVDAESEDEAIAIFEEDGGELITEVVEYIYADFPPDPHGREGDDD